MKSNESVRTKDEARLLAHHKKMTEMPVGQLVMRQAIPSIISVLITTVYNMADTYFVSQIGTSAAGAVGVVFSLMAVFQAVGYTLGMGSGNVMSRQMGAMETDKANCTASTGVFTAFAIGLLFAIFGHLFIEDLMLLLGATPTILPHACAYGQYILLAAPFMCASFVLSTLLRCEGKSTLGTIGLTIGGLLNIGLDPLFIFTFGLGTAGAALATAVSQLVGFVILLSFFMLKKSNVRLSIKLVSRKAKVYGNIVFTGFPSLSRQGLSSIANLLLNRSAYIYGDAAIAAMGIVGKVFMFIFSAVLGFLQGYQPIAGFNYGAKKYERVKKATYFAGGICVAATVVIGIVCFTIAPEIISVFRRDDPDVIRIGALALQMQCVVLPLCALTTICSFVLQSTGQRVMAIILSMCRQGIFYIPLILILPNYFGLLGIQMTQTISDVLTLLVSIPFLIHFLRNLSKRINEQHENKPVTAGEKEGDR